MTATETFEPAARTDVRVGDVIGIRRDCPLPGRQYDVTRVTAIEARTTGSLTETRFTTELHGTGLWTIGGRIPRATNS